MTFIGCCAPNVFFVVERERKSKRGSRGLTQLFSASEPGHFSVFKNRKLVDQGFKNRKLVGQEKKRPKARFPPVF